MVRGQQVLTDNRYANPLPEDLHQRSELFRLRPSFCFMCFKPVMNFRAHMTTTHKWKVPSAGTMDNFIKDESRIPDPDSDPDGKFRVVREWVRQQMLDRALAEEALLKRFIDMKDVEDDIDQLIAQCKEANCTEIFGSRFRKAVIRFTVNQLNKRGHMVLRGRSHYYDESTMEDFVFSGFSTWQIGEKLHFKCPKPGNHYPYPKTVGVEARDYYEGFTKNNEISEDEGALRGKKNLRGLRSKIKAAKRKTAASTSSASRSPSATTDIPTTSAAAAKKSTKKKKVATNVMILSRSRSRSQTASSVSPPPDIPITSAAMWQPVRTLRP